MRAGEYSLKIHLGGLQAMKMQSGRLQCQHQALLSRAMLRVSLKLCSSNRRDTSSSSFKYGTRGRVERVKSGRVWKAANCVNELAAVAIWPSNTL